MASESSKASSFLVTSMALVPNTVTLSKAPLKAKVKQPPGRRNMRDCGDGDGTVVMETVMEKGKVSKSTFRAQVLETQRTQRGILSFTPRTPLSHKATI